MTISVSGFEGKTTMMTEVPVTSTLPTEAELLLWLGPVEDPELRMPLVSLGLIYACDVEPMLSDPSKASVDVRMTLTSPACPAAGYMVEQVKKRLEENPSVAEAKVKIVFEPKWDPKTMANEEAKEKLGLW